MCPSPSLKSQALVMQLLSEDHHIDFSSEKHQHEIIFDRERLVLSGVVGAWYILRNGRIREPLIAFSFFEFLNCILFIFLYSRFLLVIHFIHISVYMSIPIYQFIPTPPPLLLSPLGVHTFLLYICVSISAPQTGSSLPFFYVPHICVNIQYLFFSF